MRIGPQHWPYAVVAATAAFAGMYIFLWIRAAAAMAPALEAAPVPRAHGRADRDPRPMNGNLHEKTQSTSRAGAYWVLRDQQRWKMTRAADACERAAMLHRVVVQRYAQKTTASREGDALQHLPATLAYLWIEATDEATAGSCVRETDATVLTVRAGSSWGSDARRAMAACFTGEEQRKQLAALAE